MATISNYGFGSGFGISYFSTSAEALDAAYKSYLKAGPGYGVYDSLFIRGQHSSIVNVFFRLGFIGVVVFIMFFFHILSYAEKYKNDKNVRALTPVLLSGILNISVHVGLESPPFLMTIAISTGFLLAAISSSRRDSVCIDG